MSQSIELDSGKKSVQFIAENETNEKMAIEFSVKERKMDALGKEDLPDTKSITIFPPQLIIPPKEKRTIRVNWNGPSDIKGELPFRVIAEQLPLDVEGKKKASGIQMLMRYMAALYVTPKNVESKLEPVIQSSKAGELSLLVKNTGSKHQVLTKPILIINKNGKKWILKEKDLEGVQGENVLAGSERIFKIKAKETYPLDAEVTLKVEE
ncbi:MAG: fimbria/pilus periplasmic chaperone [Bdellovibrionota bacterium]